ncbi:hypothetical protein PWT90_10501 [Aphanocladium album]|nr:hypothetical protein PWT90_10501 [Aphanocladium album]
MLFYCDLEPNVVATAEPFRLREIGDICGRPRRSTAPRPGFASARSENAAAQVRPATYFQRHGQESRMEAAQALVSLATSTRSAAGQFFGIPT